MSRKPRIEGPNMSRYWSNVVLGCLHRSLAILEWQTGPTSYSTGQDRLARTLGAFDMFVLDDRTGDMDEVSAIHIPVSSGLIVLDNHIVEHHCAENRRQQRRTTPRRVDSSTEGRNYRQVSGRQ